MSVAPSQKTHVNYQLALEQLEARRGRLIAVGDWYAVERKSASALSDDDLIVMGFFAGPQAAADAHARRAAALAPPVVPETTRKQSPVVDTAAAARLVDALDAALEKAWEKDDEGDLDTFMRAHRAMPVSLGVLHALALKSILAVNRRNRQRQAQIDELAAKIVELESRGPGMKYLGVWRDDATYEHGDVVTKSGSMWVSKLAANHGTPGQDGGVGWTLAVKHGRDARDR